jgi:hypothetical protein
MNDDDPKAIRVRSAADGDQAERRYAASLVALDAAAEPSAVVGRSAGAAAADLARLNQIWQPDGAGPKSLGVRILAELRRLLPWRRRQLHGAMIAAINRIPKTHALIDTTQHFSRVIWYARRCHARGARRRDEDLESSGASPRIHAMERTGWALDAPAARDERFTKAYEELRRSRPGAPSTQSPAW